MIDVNVYLGQWPFRRLPDDEPKRLADRLRRYGVSQAWTGSFEGVLHRDVGGVNRRLAQMAASVGGSFFSPIGCVHPLLPDWREDVRRCHAEYGMRGIRLHPNYHQYELSHPAFAELLDLAGERGLLVQIAVAMEDDRTQHPLVQVPAVKPAPLAELLPSRPQLKVMLLNSQRAGWPSSDLEKLAALPNLSVDVAMQEGAGGIAKLMKSYPYERIMFGSYAPFFYFESAYLKLQESELGDAVVRAITEENARGVLGSE